MGEIICQYRSNVHNEGDKPEAFYEVGQCKLIDDFIWEGKGCAFIMKKTCEFCQKAGAPSLKNPNWMIICENHLKGPLGALKSGVIGTWQEKGFDVDKTIGKMKLLGIASDMLRARIYWAYMQSIVDVAELEAITQKYALDSEITEKEINELEAISGKMDIP